MTAISIDFETASELSLPDVGVWNYVMHPSTFVRCMAWQRHDTGESGIWRPGWKITSALEEGLREGEVHAWNAQFERLVFEYLVSPQRLPHPTFNQWRCTAAQARQNALPGKLEKCAEILKTDQRKMPNAIMKKLASASYDPTDEELVMLCEYCMGDVKTEMEIGQKLPPWKPDELYAYRHNERINDRGVLIDTKFCKAMLAKLEQATGEINCELTKITDGQVTAFTQVPAMKKFLDIPGSLDAAAIEHLLGQSGINRTHRRVLELRQMGAKSSTAKYQQILNRVSSDNRLRGMFLYAGAGQTGRYSSVGVQLHNLVRDVPKDAADRIESVKQMDYRAYRLVYPEPMIHQAARLIRPALIAPPGKTFVIADYSAVEAKGLPWLAGEEYEVEQWAAGTDRYVEDAANVFAKPESEITPDERQAGKVVRLACGFAGKGGALLAMAKGYGMDLSRRRADSMAAAWHAANPWVVQFAKHLHAAAGASFKNPGTVYPAGPHLAYGCEVRDDVKVLRCRLPSGRIISYHDVMAHWNPSYGSFELSAIKPREGYRERLWHGLLSENVTQATCNDLLRFAIAQLYKAGYAIVAHVHDEVVIEVPAQAAESEVQTIQQIMEEAPEWATGFPLTAKLAVANRYTK